MLRVRCQANAKVDAKGRMALPAPLRRALNEADENRLVLTLCKGAIWGWTPRHFEEEVERPLMGADPFAEDVADFVHAILAPAQDVEIDNQGRIRIPAPLRDLAGLSKDVVVISVLHRLEIWDRDAWEERFRRSLDRSEKTSGMPGGA